MAIVDKPTDYFNTILWTGNDTDNRIISTVGFAPNWSWIKARNNADQHYLVDTVRGSTKVIFSDSTSAEQTRVSAVKSFASDGYVLGQEAQVNRNGGTFVSWNWKAGTSVSGNTGGSGTAKSYSGSVNTDAGFSIITYVGNNSAGMTVPHHLGAVPKMIIVKNRDEGSESWQVYHGSLGATKYLNLNLTNAVGTNSNRWNNTEPTSSVFTNGANGATNENNSDHVAYCFAEKEGFSKMGIYTGNGSDTPNGVFAYLGFTPAYILIKATDSNSWVIVNNKSPDDSNPVDNSLAADSTATESTGDSNTTFDFLSNGFRTNGNSGNNNSSGQEYIFMAFASSPFVTSTGNGSIPGTAR